MCIVTPMAGVDYRESEAKSVLNPVKGMGFRWLSLIHISEPTRPY